VQLGLIIVYGATQEENKEDFLAELSSFGNSMLVPYVVGEDFNILRHAEEKNAHFVQSHSSDLFNSIIHTLGLREIYMHRGKYTWSNNHANPTLEKFDIILMSANWEGLFPFVTVWKLLREFSDHNALLLDSGSSAPYLNGSREFLKGHGCRLEGGGE
jgi:hypothetical protein